MQASFLLKKSDRFAANLDARIKLFFCAAGSIAAMYCSSPFALALLLLGTSTLALSATSMRIICIATIAAILMALTTVGFSWLISLPLPKIFGWNPVLMIIPFLRMLIVIMLLLALILSTPVQQVIEHLNSMRLPSIIAIPITVAIRFIPTFIDDCKQILDAGRLRPGNGILSTWRCIVIPLIFRMFSSADDLAVAAELKGVSPEKKIRVQRAAQLSRQDYTVLFLALVILALALTVQAWDVPKMGMKAMGSMKG